MFKLGGDQKKKNLVTREGWDMGVPRDNGKDDRKDNMGH